MAQTATAAPAASDHIVDQEVMRKVTRRLVWFLFALFIATYIDRINISFAALSMNQALGLNAIEAQACGTPVLAPDAPPFTETVLEGASGFRYRDPREDGGRHFAEILDAILAGRPRPDPRLAAEAHLERFTHSALVARARGMIGALSDLE